MGAGDVSGILNYMNSGTFSHAGPLLIWCVILIVVGFKGVKYDRRKMVMGIRFYALSLILPVLPVVLIAILAGGSHTPDSSALLHGTSVIVAILTQCVSALAVAYPLLAIFTSGKSADE